MGAMADPRKETVASGYDRLAERYLNWASGTEADGSAWSPKSFGGFRNRRLMREAGFELSSMRWR
jgi:hypothetical protein